MSDASLDRFWDCGDGIHALDDPTPFGQENALQKLGKPPFEKGTRGRFRLLGYLATVYEHVAQDVGKAQGESTESGPANGVDQVAELREPAPAPQQQE